MSSSPDSPNSHRTPDHKSDGSNNLPRRRRNTVYSPKKYFLNPPFPTEKWFEHVPSSPSPKSSHLPAEVLFSYSVQETRTISAPVDTNSPSRVGGVAHGEPITSDLGSIRPGDSNFAADVGKRAEDGDEQVRLNAVLTCIRNGFVNDLRSFLDYIDVNLFDPETLECPLSVAFEDGNTEIIRILLEKGANILLSSKLDLQRRRKVIQTDPARRSPSFEVSNSPFVQSQRDLLGAILEKDENNNYLMTEESITCPNVVGYSPPRGCTIMRVPLEKFPNAKFPQLSFQPLFIRNFYHFFYENILKKCRNPSLCFPGAVISGNAGIGKSAFGLYVLVRAIREGRTVVYVEGKEGGGVGNSILFEGDSDAKNGIRQVHIYDFEIACNLLQEDSNALFILDSCAIGFRMKPFCLTLMSPNQKEWNGCLKWFGEDKQYTFPNWCVAELAALNFVAPTNQEWKSLSFDTRFSMIQKNYSMCGGLPRYICDPTYYITRVEDAKEKLIKYLHNACDYFQYIARNDIFAEDFPHIALCLTPSFVLNKADEVLSYSRNEVNERLHKLLKHWNECLSDLDSEVESRVFHPFGFCSATFSSKWVVNEIMKHVLSADAILSLLASHFSSPTPYLAGVVGTAFESKFLEGLYFYRTFPLVRLHSGNKVTNGPVLPGLKFPPSDGDICNFIDLCKSDEPRAFVPAACTAAFDCILWSGQKFYFLQLTVSTKHDIKFDAAKGLSMHSIVDKITKLDESRKKKNKKGVVINFVWVIHSSLKSYYSYQSSTGSLIWKSTVTNNYLSSSAYKELQEGEMTPSKEKLLSQLAKERDSLFKKFTFYHLYFDSVSGESNLDVKKYNKI